jgi:hypothetical protein
VVEAGPIPVRVLADNRRQLGRPGRAARDKEQQTTVVHHDARRNRALAFIGRVIVQGGFVTCEGSKL